MGFSRGRLQSITVDPANLKYFSIDGVLYSKENDCLLAYPSGKSGPFDTPSFVGGYANYSFLGCRALTSIHLGPNVTQIGSYAFADCTSLTELRLHAKIKDLDLFSIAGCTNLKDIYVDNPSLIITFIGWNITSINDASVIRSAREKFLPTIGQGQLVVHAPKGSTAAKFAEQCALKFEPMYNGQRKQIELVCSNDVMDAIIDKFGKDVTVLANDMQSFRAVVNTAVGHVFYSWVFGFAGKVTIKSPNDVKKSYAIMVKQAAQALIE